ncbi:MAG: SDR family NAD(P)-dependent oxidoreductase, partial [Roseateles sp.]|uniref:SDR family NAD(P)-dependent oxidoreductase n=1 Tax=Roseateles sp. TaxID=1971397 RepID=UPI004036CB70
MNPIVLVTGARGGIGRALCAQLRAQGWQVAAVGREAAGLADVPAALRIQADTTTPEGAAAAIAQCREV